jgi:hypothetical protein
MIDAFSTPRNRTTSLILLGICPVLAVTAVLIGIDDNLPGILLAFIAALAFVLAFAHPWRKARKFLFLLLASVIGFILFTILMITLDTVANDPGTAPALRSLLDGSAVNAIIIIIGMLLAASILVGTVGSIVMSIRGCRKK